MYRAVNGDPFFNGQRPGSVAALRAAVTAGSFPDRNTFLPHVPLLVPGAEPRRQLRELESTINAVVAAAADVGFRMGVMARGGDR